MLDKLVRHLVVVIALGSFTFFRLKKLKLTDVHNRSSRQSDNSFRGNKQSAPRGGTTKATTNTTNTTPSAASRLPSVDNYVLFFYYFSLVYPMYMILKYLVICSLDNRRLANYRYISCYLVGRFIINGRVTGFSNYVTLLCYVCQLIWRVIMLNHGANIELDCFEFLLYDYQTILGEEIRSVNYISEWANPPPKLQYYYYSRTNEKHLSLFEEKLTNSRNRRSSCGLLNYENLNYEQQQQENEHELQKPRYNHRYSLRLNRTAKAWSHLSIILIGLVIFDSIVITTITPVLLKMMIPVIYTERGFQLNYPNCLDWIMKHPNRSDYSHITTALSANLQPKAFLPMVDYVQLNRYHLIRTTWDVFETLTGYFDVMFGFVFNPLVAFIVGADVQYYTHELNKRLSQINGWLSARNHGPLSPPPSSSSSAASAAFKDVNRIVPLDGGASQLDSKINDLQSIIFDYLVTVKHYNSYAAKHILFIVSVWFTFSGLICSRLVVPNYRIDKSNEPEWYLIMLISTIFTFTVMGSFARIRSSSRTTYSLINAVMARDCGCNRRKKRWLAIGNFFYPKPIYCFTWLPATEISWLSIMKVNVYLLSALVVAASLFSPNDH